MLKYISINVRVRKESYNFSCEIPLDKNADAHMYRWLIKRTLYSGSVLNVFIVFELVLRVAHLALLGDLSMHLSGKSTL